MPSHTRREFTKLALAGLPALSLFSRVSHLGAAEEAGKPNSKVAGVQIGLNVPYSFANGMMTGDEILKNCVQLGLSGVELRTQPVEQFLGVPPDWLNAKKGEDKAVVAKNQEQLRDWRKSAPIEKAKEFRTKYETAG